MDGVTTSIVGSSVVGAAGSNITGRQTPKRPEQKEKKVERKTRDML